MKTELYLMTISSATNETKILPTAHMVNHVAMQNWHFVSISPTEIKELIKSPQASAARTENLCFYLQTERKRRCSLHVPSGDAL